MKLKFTLLTILLCGVGSLSAQLEKAADVENVLKVEVKDEAASGWRFGGVTNLNFSQLLLRNWVAGGQDSYSLNGLISTFASYKKNSLIWDNNLDLGYGFVHQNEDPIKEFRKTDDRIEFNSKVGYKAFSDFYYSGLVNFKTQFGEGYNYKVDPGVEPPVISNFFSPAYLTAALGLSYQPNAYFSAFLAPVSSRFTIVTDENLRASYKVDLDKSMRFEFGGYLRTVFSKNDFQAPILKNITLTSKLDLFSNYLHNPQNIDVNWEVLVALKINKYLSANVSTHLIYDDDIVLPDQTGPKVQFKELFGVGLSYNF